MFKFILPILVSVALATSASAQSNSDSNSVSDSMRASGAADSDAASTASNSLTFEGSNTASSASVGGAMHTAPCVIGNGIALGVVGGGIAFSNGRIDSSCLGRAEAQWIIKLLGMAPGIQQNAAIYHACANIETIRETLVSLGVCVMKPRG